MYPIHYRDTFFAVFHLETALHAVNVPFVSAKTRKAMKTAAARMQEQYQDSTFFSSKDFFFDFSLTDHTVCDKVLIVKVAERLRQGLEEAFIF